MARISGIDLPKNKRIEVGLTYVFGIGLTTSQKILTALAIDFNTRVKNLSEDEIVKLRDAVNEHPNEGDLRRKINQDIRRLGEINSFRGSRHRKKLPCRGQRTHTNARTKKGKRIAVAGKKKVTK
ncbi:MAG: 30S ribosomal protein S13 [Candidatus Margulisbacteria bacterium]|nr:30S ribosomal protein S13 [Candidatus Margulisiibacteriota bacterium]